MQIDNKKLKDEIESLKKTTNKDLQEQLQSKINEINILNKEKKELKEKFNEYKYADKTINEYKNKNLLLRETIDRLNIKHDELLKKINNLNEKLIPKKEENKDPKKMNEKKKLNEQRSSSVINIKKEKEKEKEKNKFYCSGNNFYKLFNDSEQKAFSRLFKSEQDLNNFKKKIHIIEKRNNKQETVLKNDNKELSKQNEINQKRIINFNEKMKDNERKIKEYQNQIKNQKNINTNLIKQNKKIIVIEKNYIEIINKKEEEIKSLKEENNKLNEILSQMKTDVEKINIEKSKEKELKELKDEIGVIEIIDVNKYLNITKKFSIEYLQEQRGIEHSFNGKKSKMNNKQHDNDKNENNGDNNENKKKKKKKKIEVKKDNEQNGNNEKPCKKIKNEKERIE